MNRNLLSILHICANAMASMALWETTGNPWWGLVLFNTLEALDVSLNKPKS